MHIILAELNLALWTIILIVYGIGNLTYADYYTKLSTNTKETINTLLLVQFICFSLNMLIISIVGNIKEGFAYGLIWCSGVSVLIYLYYICFLSFLGFAKLKMYFGKKRGKI